MIAINSANSWAYEERGTAKALLKDDKGACADFQESALLGRKLLPQSSRYLNWCRSMLIFP